MKISKAFLSFKNDSPKQSEAWAEMVGKLSEASVLDPKTKELIYIGILAAVGLDSGIPFHVKNVKSKGASRDEIISAILVGLPATGHRITKGLSVAVEAYDED